MATVRKFGKPDFFITMTTNPAWPDVIDNLHGQETAHNRPDLVARVFRMKLKSLLNDLIQRGVLGKPVGYTWVIEFQKRGVAPCTHIAHRTVGGQDTLP